MNIIIQIADHKLTPVALPDKRFLITFDEGLSSSQIEEKTDDLYGIFLWEASNFPCKIAYGGQLPTPNANPVSETIDKIIQSVQDSEIMHG